MRASATILALLFVALLLVAGCGGEQGEAPTKSPDKGVPATTAPTAAGSATTAPDQKGPASTTPAVQSAGQRLTLEITNSAGQKVDVPVEVASTPEERQRGLMGRTALAEDAGMLFAYNQDQPLSFWMKDTLIPLSIAFINEQGRIVDIQDMQPLDETPHTSVEPARYALEVNQGFFSARGIEVGNVVEQRSQ